MSKSTMKQAMKVKIIETQFVQTDATQFKSVVQRYTGKDSTPFEVNGEIPKKEDEALYDNKVGNYYIGQNAQAHCIVDWSNYFHQ